MKRGFAYITERTVCSAIFLCVLALLGTGCVRAGFDTKPSQGPFSPDDALGNPGGEGFRDALATDRPGVYPRDAATDRTTHISELTLTAAHNDCEDALLVNLVKTPFPLQITLNPSGATPLYDPFFCQGKPAFIIQFENYTGDIVMTCSGDGEIYYHVPTLSGDCPGPLADGSYFGGLCRITSSNATSILPKHYVLICRSPADGPAVITINKQS